MTISETNVVSMKALRSKSDLFRFVKASGYYSVKHVKKIRFSFFVTKLIELIPDTTNSKWHYH